MKKFTNAIYIAVILLSMTLWVPTLFGYHTCVVVSGSMEPTISAGSIAFVRKGTSCSEGDIIAFHYGDSVVLHRAVQVLSDGTVFTKGDANTQRDRDPVQSVDVLGVLSWQFPIFGYVTLPLLDSTGRVLLVIALLLLFALSRLLEKPENYESKAVD